MKPTYRLDDNIKMNQNEETQLL